MTVRDVVSRPAPESLPSPRLKVTAVSVYHGAFPPVSVIVWPVGAVESAVT